MRMKTTLLSSWFFLVIVIGYVQGSAENCYEEDKHARRYPISPGNYDPLQMTIITCTTACGELTLRYAALTYGKFCFCGNDDPDDAKKTTSGCTTPCSGNSQQMCGDSDHASVYKSAQHFTDLELSVKSHIDYEVNFEAMAEPLSIVVDYQMDYGEGNGRTQKNASELFIKHYVLPGDFTATLYASGRNNTAPEVQASTLVSVNFPVTNVSVECPKLTASHEEIECLLTVVDGSSLTVTSNMDDGQGPQTYAIADATRFVAGPEIPSTSTATGTTEDGFYLMPSSEFQWEGVIVAWEIFATKAGKINLLILKPDCTDEYCYTSLKCGTCQPGMAYKCDQQSFNTATGMCGNSTTQRYTGTLLVTYTVADKIENVQLTQGYNYHKLDIPTQSKEVKPGYILAYQKLSGGAVIAQTSTAKDFKSNDIPTIDSAVTNANLLQFGHLIRAVASHKSVLSLVHTYKTQGEKVVTFRVASSNKSSTPVEITENISVQLGIDKIWIEANRYQKTNDNVSFEIHEHTGQNVTYEWNFGDGTVVNATTRQITHTFANPGSFNISVRAWNQLSAKGNFTEIITEDVIKGLNVTGDPVATTDPAHIWIDRSSGSDFSCELSYGDKNQPESLDSSNFPIGGMEKQHKYEQEGTYNVILVCSNNVSQESVRLKQVVVDPITDLKLVEEGMLKGEDKHLNFSIATGSMVSLTLTLDGVQQDITYDDKTKKGITVKSFEWTQLGVHTVVMIASNAISNVTVMVDFVIEKEIKDAEMTVVNNMKKIKVDESVTYEVTMQSGTGVHIDWIFGDGQNYSVAEQNSVDWTPGKKEVKKHTFHLAGDYEVKVIVYNKQKKITFTHQLVVLAPIENLTLESDSPVRYTPPGQVSLMFKQGQGQRPAGALMNITYGDGKSDINLPFDLSKIYEHAYDDISTYTVKASVANELSGITLSTTVNVVEPIEGISIKPDPPHASVNEPVKISVYMYRGGTDDVNITWDFGDGHVEKTRRTGESPDKPDVISHTYTTVKNYTITVSAVNPLGVVNHTYEIACQHPVLKATVTSNAPAHFYDNSSIRILVSMKYIGTQPTDAMMYWDDGTGDATSKTTPKPFKTKDEISLVYHRPGNFEGKLVIYNLASREEFPFNAGVFKKITEVDVLAKYTPKLPLNSPDLPSDQNLLPFDRPIRFHATSDGTVVEYEAVLMKDGNSYYCNSTATPFTCEFPEPGKYDVNITAKNYLPSAASQIISLEVANRLTGMTVECETKAKLNEQVNITLTFQTMGDKSCVTVDFGDGSPVAYYGSDDGCTQKPDNIELSGKVEKTLKLKHNFTAAGTYTIKYAAVDGFGKHEEEKTVVVSDVACKPPNILIRDASTDFEKPFVMKRNKLMRILTKTKITCAFTRDNVKQWAIHVVNPLTGEETGEVIDISKNPSAITAELALQPRFLALGLYKIIYTVTMDPEKFPSKEIFRSKAFTYIDVQKPDLVGIMIRGGSSEILWGHNTTLTLAPANFSYDPSIPRNDDQGFTSFTWFCKRNDQKYDMDADTGPSGAGFSEKGGCFGLGPGKIQFSKGIISFSTQWMPINETFDIMVIMKKDIRKVNVSLTVKIVEGIPGESIITCSPGLCSQISSGQLVNPSARLGLAAECTLGCTSPDKELKYQWELYYFQYRWNWRPIENITEYTRGFKTKYLAVMTKIFKDFYPATKFRAKVTIIDEKALTRAVTAMNFIVNQAPENGSCSVTPKEGRTGQDFFNLTCTNWTDDQKVAEYMFYAKFKENTLTKQISFGPESSIQVYMPLGPDYDNFTMEVMCKVFDSFGAYATVSLGEVRVLPMSSDKLDALLQDLTSGSVNLIEDAMANGDLQETNTVFSTMASALNSASKQADQAMYANKSERTPTGYGKDYEYRTAEELLPMSEADYQSEQANKFDNPAEQQRNLRAKGRAKMAEALNTITVSTISGIQLTASTLSTVCKHTEECGRDAQKAVSQNIVKMSDTLKHLGSETPREELSVAGESLFAVIGETLEATNYHIKDPLIEDMENVADTMVYDTDLDSSQGSIASGDPAKGMNELKYIANKEQQTKEALKESKKIMGSMAAVTKTLSSSLVPGEDPMNMITPKMAISISKSSASDLSSKKMNEGGGGFKLPDWCSMKGGSCDPDEVVAVEVMATPGNIFSFAANKAVSDSSGTMSINYMSNDQSDISIAGTKEPVEIVIPRDPSFKAPPAAEVQPVLLYNETLFFHTFWANNTNSSLHIEIKPSNASAQLLVLVRMEHMPNLTTGEWDHVQMVPSTMESAENYTEGDFPNPYMVFVSDEVVGNRTGKVYVGVRQLEADEIDMYYPNSTIPDFEPKTGNFTTNYTLRTFTSGCLYFKETVSDWVTDGCHVGSETDLMRTQCFCNHMTAFSAGLMVAPNAIDWDRVLNNASFAENPTLYITQIVILIVYIGAACWSRYQDKKDLEKLGLTPLKCNNPNSKYYYEIMVFTGMRKDSDTTSKVHFILSGEYDETEVRSLSDDKRKILQRGSEDGFLMAVPRPLGALTYARIWHDNSGKGKFGSWYLKHFLVRDVQTGQKFHFVVNKWFAVEEDDGQIDRIIPVAGKEQLMNFSHMFSKRARKNLGDGHLWFSVVGRPPGSTFTRLQRVSCCLTLLFTSMFANALYYGKESGGGGGLSFGPFSVSIETMSMGFVSNLVVLPVNVLIVTLFRKSKPRKEKPSRIEQALKESAEAGGSTSVNDVKVLGGWDEITKSSTSLIDSESRPGTCSSRPRTPKVRKGGADADKKKKKKKFMFPWWCVIISWIVLWLTVAGCCAGVTFYGITFGNEKCTKWISSMLISFFSSVFITEPIKVFGMAILLSLILKNPAEEDEGEEEDETVEMGDDEEFLHTNDGFGAARPRKSAYKPPDPERIERMRAQRLQEIKMWEVIKEVIVYSFFLWILMVISYRNRSPWAYRTKYALEKQLIETNNDFSSVVNTRGFWEWAKNDLTAVLRAGKYYNGDPPLMLRGFMGDKVSRMMGYAVMRQLRASPKKCKMAKILKPLGLECHRKYSILNQDEGVYGRKWEELYINDTYSNMAEEYKYTDSKVLDGYPYYGNTAVYGGGGYVVQLKGSETKLKAKMLQLQNENWIDEMTRAVFVEFTIYNPQVNLFTVCTILAEFTGAGSIITSYRFEPCMLLPYMTQAALFQILVEIVFVAFLIYFIVKEVKTLIKLRKLYIKEFWNLVELGIVSLSIGGMFIFMYKTFETNRLTEMFKKTQGNEYMKFQYVALWNQLFTYIVGWVVFLATLKFMKLLRFNKRMSLLSTTLSESAPGLLNFSLVFWIFFLAFVQVFYLLYFKQLAEFSNFVTGAETGFLMMMGQFDFEKMKSIQPIIFPIVFSLFVITITFILINMFLSILNETFASVREDLDKQSNDYEIVDFMVGRFKTWTGIGAASVSPEDIKKPNSDSDNPEGQIENFPDKVDKLLNSISSVYMEKDTLEAFFDDRNEAGKMALKKIFKQQGQTNLAYQKSPTGDYGLPKVQN